jgi:hypothetical protein
MQPSVCQWPIEGCWFSPCTMFSYTNKTICHNSTVELPKTGLSENLIFSFGPEYSPYIQVICSSNNRFPYIPNIGLVQKIYFLVKFTSENHMTNLLTGKSVNHVRCQSPNRSIQFYIKRLPPVRAWWNQVFFYKTILKYYKF